MHLTLMIQKYSRVICAHNSFTDCIEFSFEHWTCIITNFAPRPSRPRPSRPNSRPRPSRPRPSRPRPSRPRPGRPKPSRPRPSRPRPSRPLLT